MFKKKNVMRGDVAFALSIGLWKVPLQTVFIFEKPLFVHYIKLEIIFFFFL